MAKGSRGGRRGGGTGLNPGDIISTRDMLSESGVNQALVNDTLQVFKDFNDEYGYQVEQIQLAKLKPKANALAYYDWEGNIAVNEKFFNDKAMDDAYKRCIESGFHPSNGNKTTMQAVVSHEIGHGLTAEVGKKLGINDLDATATVIVKEARKQTKHKGVVQMASKISGYATHSNAEAVAEAMSDVYCNGKKARAESRAIVNVMDKYLKN